MYVRAIPGLATPKTKTCLWGPRGNRDLGYPFSCLFQLRETQVLRLRSAQDDRIGKQVPFDSLRSAQEDSMDGARREYENKRWETRCLAASLRCGEDLFVVLDVERQNQRGAKP